MLKIAVLLQRHPLRLPPPTLLLLLHNLLPQMLLLLVLQPPLLLLLLVPLVEGFATGSRNRNNVRYCYLFECVCPRKYFCSSTTATVYTVAAL
uniref:Putative secreted protein n=1 Tax=Psorophora albipes TaxID=869069 RepID=T1E2R9_9DIPT